ncbi:MAG: hypothetical protein HY889_05820 [Deltaproteobacteria bacterium]|nr:hypothetical protein [Deltaproteobacteria bacterium]
MDRIYSSRWFHFMAAAVITGSILIAYSNTFHAAFQFDDLPQIVENDSLKSLSNLTTLLRQNRGVTMATFALNYAWGGLDVTGYHIVNTAVHALASFFAYLLLYNIFRTAGAKEAWSKRVAFFSALFFAVHPIQTQSVTYIVQRMESLASLFYILALFFFVLGANAATAPKRLLLYSATIAAYVLGFYSKEIAITVPAVILLTDFFFISKKNLRGIVSRLPLYALLFALLGYFLFATIRPLGGFSDLSRESAVGAEVRKDAVAKEVHPKVQRDVQPVFEGPSAGFSQTAITPKEYLYTQFNVLLYYIGLLIVPVNQNLDYDFPVAKSLNRSPAVNSGTVLNLPVWPPVVSLMILLGIAALAFYLLFRPSKDGSAGLIVSFFIFWFFIILSPTSSVVPIIDVIYEHRVYLASLGFFTVLVICADTLAARVFSRMGA